ncbi:hypothetical protein EDB84DRAFT_1562221 [Lactarius hengduanensis]|nr:hypothetical protein EDB84DRAFT_1562221 [Lactarius hengduanensis]
MGDGIQAKPNQGKPTPADSSSIMRVCALSSTPERRPAFGLVFLLNHTASLRANILKPRAPVLAEDREKLGGAGKAGTEKFTRFFDLLDEIKERHQLARVLEDDEEQRALVEDEVPVAELVVPSLQRFTQKMREEFSKNIRNCSEHSLGTVRAQAGLQAGTCVIAELTGGG